MEFRPQHLRKPIGISLEGFAMRKMPEVSCFRSAARALNSPVTKILRSAPT